jgi:hypothetical protein
MKVRHTEPCPRCRENGKDHRGDNLVVYADGGYHCFSCNLHRATPQPWLPKEKVEPYESKVLPADASRAIPGVAWQWLLQYGLTYQYWKPFVWWSDHDSRLVFTVGDPHPEFSIGRYIQQPGVDHKYASRKWFVYGESHKTPHVFGNPGESSTVVLVEDLISAHKVGVITTCIPLFGTKVFDACIPALRHIRLPITIWLDKDQEGTVQKKAANLALLTGCPVRYVFTDKDAKALSMYSIKKALSL